MKDLIEFFVRLLNEYPALAAGVIGTVFSMASTQFFKFMVPPEWSTFRYRLSVRLAGFFSGWFFGLGAWILLQPGQTTFGKVYFATGIGIMSPLVYSLIVPIVVHFFPYLDKVLSGRPNVSIPPPPSKPG